MSNNDCNTYVQMKCLVRKCDCSVKPNLINTTEFLKKISHAFIPKYSMMNHGKTVINHSQCVRERLYIWWYDLKRTWGLQCHPHDQVCIKANYKPFVIMQSSSICSKSDHKSITDGCSRCARLIIKQYIIGYYAVYYVQVLMINQIKCFRYHSLGQQPHFTWKQ